MGREENRLAIVVPLTARQSCVRSEQETGRTRTRRHGVGQRSTGDPHAFGALYERYLKQIYRYCYVRLGNREAAEDATSEVFLKALRGLDNTEAGTFIAWLYRIAGNVIIDTYRRRSHPTCPIENIGYLEDDAPTPETAAMMSAERSDLNRALASLPPEYRTVIVLQLAGWTGEQIACTLKDAGGSENAPLPSGPAAAFAAWLPIATRIAT